MKKIGITSAGNVIVELTIQEFDALQRPPCQAKSAAANGTIPAVPAPRMSHTERASYVAERLRKLSPKKKEGVIRSVEAMFQFTGGIERVEVERLLSTLQKAKLISITQDGKVSYPQREHFP